MVQITFKRKKDLCPYNRSCKDFNRIKCLCQDNEWVYCLTFQRLDKKDGRDTKQPN